MVMKGNTYTRVPLFALLLAVVVWVVSGCAVPTSVTGKPPVAETEPASVESLKIQAAGDEETVVEIVNSRSAPYTSFKLIDPPRVVVDIRGVPGKNLAPVTQWNDQNVTEVRVETGKTQPLTTRVVIGMARPADFIASDQDNVITLTVKSRPQAMTTTQVEQGKEPLVAQKEPVTPQDPRIFFQPGFTKGKHQVLGVDFTMLNHGKSRLTVTTNTKVPYDLERKGPKALTLVLDGTTIPPLLLRRLESTYFEGAVDRVKASYVSENQLSFAILLREMVPFHVDQKEKEIHIEFGPSAVEAPKLKMVPMSSTSEAPKIVTAETAPAVPTVRVREMPNPLQLLLRPHPFRDSKKRRNTGAPT